MDLGRKLAEIRDKPEYIRLRYVWGAVAVSMVFIVVIWIFSMREAFKSTQTDGASSSFSELKKQFDAQKENIPSYEDMMGQPPGGTAQNSIESMGADQLAPNNNAQEGQPAVNNNNSAPENKNNNNSNQPVSGNNSKPAPAPPTDQANQ
jgi:hypothetical protein